MKIRSPKPEVRKTSADRNPCRLVPQPECGLRNSGFLRILAFMIRILPSLSFAAAAQITNDIPPLRPPHAEIPPTLWEQHGGSVSVGAVILLALIGWGVWQSLRPKPETIVPLEIQARQALEQLLNQPESGAVLSRISQILRRYATVGFSLPPEEMTTTEFCRALDANREVGPELSIALGQFLRECDERKFAPSVSQSELNAAVRGLELVARAEDRRAQLRRVAARGTNQPANSQ